MVGHRDPNLVPVAAFYGDPDLRVNYCGKLAGDANPQVCALRGAAARGVGVRSRVGGRSSRGVASRTRARQVRLEFARVVGDWMLRLRERADHEGRLLPFLLAALVDEAPAVGAEAARLLDALGAQYEAEHEADVRELEAYCPEALAGPSAGPDGGGAEGAADSDGWLPPALRGATPRAGARLLVQGNAGRLLAPLCAELSSWQAAPRERCEAALPSRSAIVRTAVASASARCLPCAHRQRPPGLWRC